MIQDNLTILSQVSNFKKLNTDLAFNFENLFNYQNSKFKDVLTENDSKLLKFESSLNFQKRINYFNLTIITLLLVYIIVTRDTYIESEFITSIPSYQNENDSQLIIDQTHRHPRKKIY